MEKESKRLWKVVEDMVPGWRRELKRMDDRISIANLPWAKGRARFQEPFNAFMSKDDNRETLHIYSQL